MKILKKLLLRNFLKYENLQISVLKLEIKKEFRQQNKDGILSTNNDNDSCYANTLFENVLIKIINSRCEELSFISSYIKNEVNFKIKLYGEKNYLYDNSKWINLEQNGKINENLRIKEDLNFTDSHIFFIFKEYINFFEYDDKTIQKMILPYIRKSNISSLKELKIVLDDLFLIKELTEDPINKML